MQNSIMSFSIIISTIIILLICILYIINKGKKQEKKDKLIIVKKIDEIIYKYNKILFAIILVIAIFVRIYKIDTIPNGMHVDEVGMAYDAYTLQEYGVDRYLNRFPVYMINYGGGQSALYTYITAVFIKMFGNSLISIRLPALSISIIAIICMYNLVKRFNGIKSALMITFLFAIMPWHIMQSRWGLDCNLLSSMIVISLYLLAIAKRPIQYIFAGISFGITLYTYALSYIIIPIVLLISLIYMIYINKIKFSQIVLLGIPIFILALPLMLMLLVNNGIIEPISNRFFTIPKLFSYRGTEIHITEFFNNIKSLKDIYTSDNYVYNSIPIFGTLYKFSIPIMIFGGIIEIYNLIKNIKEKKFSIGTIMVIVFFANIICIGITENMNVNKANSIYIPSIYFIYVALRFIYHRYKIVFSIIIIMYIINFIVFSDFYYNKYNKEYEKIIFFDKNIINLIKYVDKYKEQNLYFKVTTCQPWTYVLYANEESPYYFNENIHDDNSDYWSNMYAYGRYYFAMPESIAENSVYIIENKDDIETELIEDGYSCEIYLGYKIYSR